MGMFYDFLHTLVGMVKETRKSIPTKLSQLEKDVEFGVKDYDALENIPVYNVSSDSDNMVYLNELESNVYRLSGYFQPFKDSGISCSFSSNQLVNVVKKTAGSHIQIFYPVNNVIQFVTIMADEAAEGGYTYERKNIYLNDLYGLKDAVGDLSGLTTAGNSNLVEAINEAAYSTKAKMIIYYSTGSVMLLDQDHNKIQTADFIESIEKGYFPTYFDAESMIYSACVCVDSANGIIAVFDMCSGETKQFLYYDIGDGYITMANV